MDNIALNKIRIYTYIVNQKPNPSFIIDPMYIIIMYPKTDFEPFY